MADGWTLTPAARGDLAALWRHGAERWSPSQADRYEDGLLDLFDLLASQPRMARERGEIAPGIRVHPHGSHIVFYRERSPGIEIVRIAHGRSDWARALD